MSEVEEVLEYYSIFEKMVKAVPDDANLMATIRAAEFLIAYCIAQANVDKPTKEKIYAHLPEIVKYHVEEFEKYKVYEESTPDKKE